MILSFMDIGHTYYMQPRDSIAYKLKNGLNIIFTSNIRLFTNRARLHSHNSVKSKLLCRPNIKPKYTYTRRERDTHRCFKINK